MPIITLKNISKSFGQIQALHNLNLNCKAGEIHVLLGENGAGKSTLVSLLAGLYPPDSGEILFNGKRAYLKSPQHSLQLGIGIVFQHPLLIPELTVLENMLLGQAWWKLVDKTKELSHFNQLSSMLGVSINPHMPLTELSLGERQQMEIMRSLWSKQQVLILDEPTSLLPPQSVQALGTMMQAFARQGGAVILITHKLNEAITLGNHISILCKGQKVGELGQSELQNSSKNVLTEKIFALMFEHKNNAQQTILAQDRLSLHPYLHINYVNNLNYARGSNIPETQHSIASPQHSIASPQHSITSPQHSIAFPQHSIAVQEKDLILAVQNISTSEEKNNCNLRDLSFSLYKGEVFGIAGIEGNGQKHLAEVLAGQRQVKNGHIILKKHDITTFNAREKQKAGIHYITADRLGEGIASTEAISINFLLKDIGHNPFWKFSFAQNKNITAFAQAKIQEFSISPQDHNTSIEKLSGGNIQKVILARELKNEHKTILIFNRPTHGLDLYTSLQVRKLLMLQAQKGIVYIIISPDLDELLSLCTKIAVISHGKITGIVDNNLEAHKNITKLLVAS